MGMCGSSMADLQGKVFNSYLDPATDLTILAYSFVPRTDRAGTHGSITLRVSMGPAAQVLTHVSNRAYGRQIIGTVNGHSIGTHIIKPYSTVAWEADQDYDYTIEFNIPYTPGTVSIVLRIVQQTGATGALACFDTGKGYTIVSGVGDPPEAPTEPILNEVLVGNLTGDVVLNWAQAAPGDGLVLGYDVYYSYNETTWKHLLRTSNLYAIIPLNKFRLSRGASVYLNISAYGYYGSGPLMTLSRSLTLARLPLPPTESIVVPALPFGQPLLLTWSGAVPNDGTILAYKVQAARLAKGSSTWSNWITIADNVVNAELETIPTSYTNWTAALWDQYKFRIFAYNTYGLISATGLETGAVQIRNGIMRAKVAGEIQSGIPWVKVNGVWRKSAEVYIKVAGVWRTAK